MRCIPLFVAIIILMHIPIATGLDDPSGRSGVLGNGCGTNDAMVITHSVQSIPVILLTCGLALPVAVYMKMRLMRGDTILPDDYNLPKRLREEIIGTLQRTRWFQPEPTLDRTPHVNRGGLREQAMLWGTTIMANATLGPLALFTVNYVSDRIDDDKPLLPDIYYRIKNSMRLRMYNMTQPTIQQLIDNDDTQGIQSYLNTVNVSKLPLLKQIAPISSHYLFENITPLDYALQKSKYYAAATMIQNGASHKQNHIIPRKIEYLFLQHRIQQLNNCNSRKVKQLLHNEKQLDNIKKYIQVMLGQGKFSKAQQIMKKYAGSISVQNILYNLAQEGSSASAISYFAHHHPKLCQNFQDENGNTLLHIAAIQPRWMDSVTQIASCVMQNTNNPKRNNNNQTPAMIARKKGRNDFITAIRNITILRNQSKTHTKENIPPEAMDQIIQYLPGDTLANKSIPQQPPLRKKIAKKCEQLCSYM